MNLCEECPLRLFNKHYNLQGIGNKFYGNLIVIPNVDYNASKLGDISFSKQIEIIREAILPTGELDNLHILPLLRCTDSISFEIDDAIYNRCIRYLIRDINQYKFTRILLLGEAVRRFLNCNIRDYLDTIIIKDNIMFNVNVSPLIKYVDEKGFETFKYYLNKWYTMCITKDINYKNYIRI